MPVTDGRTELIKREPTRKFSQKTERERGERKKKKSWIVSFIKLIIKTRLQEVATKGNNPN